MNYRVSYTIGYWFYTYIVTSSTKQVSKMQCNLICNTFQTYAKSVDNIIWILTIHAFCNDLQKPSKLLNWPFIAENFSVRTYYKIEPIHGYSIQYLLFCGLFLFSTCMSIIAVLYTCPFKNLSHSCIFHLPNQVQVE